MGIDILHGFHTQSILNIVNILNVAYPFRPEFYLP